MTNRNWELKKNEGNRCYGSSSDPLLLRLQLSIEIKCNLMIVSIKIIVKSREFDRNYELKKLKRLILIIKIILNDPF